MFGGSFAPLGWMFCQGQTLLIADFDTLFNLIGTTYGGDGQRTFKSSKSREPDSNPHGNFAKWDHLSKSVRLARNGTRDADH
jgi:microcystin-dependent protein